MFEIILAVVSVFLIGKIAQDDERLSVTPWVLLSIVTMILSIYFFPLPYARVLGGFLVVFGLMFGYKLITKN